LNTFLLLSLLYGIKTCNHWRGNNHQRITLPSSESESELSDSELSAGFFAGTDPFLAAAAAAFGFGA
jgi:hypothetical protein